MGGAGPSEAEEGLVPGLPAQTDPRLRLCPTGHSDPAGPEHLCLHPLPSACSLDESCGIRPPHDLILTGRLCEDPSPKKVPHEVPGVSTPTRLLGTQFHPAQWGLPPQLHQGPDGHASVGTSRATGFWATLPPFLSLQAPKHLPLRNLPQLSLTQPLPLQGRSFLCGPEGTCAGLPQESAPWCVPTGPRSRCRQGWGSQHPSRSPQESSLESLTQVAHRVLLF